MTAANRPPASRSEPCPRGLRITVFLLIFTFMAFGPVYRQVLDGRNPVFRPWTMFSTIGLGLANVTFSERRPDGSYARVDHYRVLGYDDWREAPLRLRRIRGLDGMSRVAAEVCAALGPGADLRARVRIAHRSGWRTELMEADGNLCASAAAVRGESGNALGD